MSRRNRKQEAVALAQLRGAMVRTLLCLLFGVVVFTWGLGQTLAYANQIYAASQHFRGTVLCLDVVLWYLLSLLLLGCLALLSYQPIQHRFSVPRPSGCAGIKYDLADAPLPFPITALFMVIAFALAVVCVLNVRTYAVLTDSEIIEQSALAISPVRYQYSDIREIAMTRRQLKPKYEPARLSTDRVLRVTFKNGTTWSPHGSYLFVTSEQEQLIGLQLSERCQIMLTYPRE